MIKVLELKGFKSLRAMNAFHALMLGLKMLPSYLGETYSEFYERIEQMSDKEKLGMIKEAVLFVNLEKDEVEAMIGFCCDPLGVPYDKSNIGNLTPDKLMECIVAVSYEISKIKIDFVSDAEKKKLKTSQLT